MCAQNSLINVIYGSIRHRTTAPLFSQICVPLNFAELRLVPRLFSFINLQFVRICRQQSKEMLQCDAKLTFLSNAKKFSFDFQLFMHRHWTMYTPCLDSDPRWRFTISDFLEIRKSHFEEILSLPTSNLTDAPARSRYFYSY